MGMFDYIRCEMPLPEPKPPEDLEALVGFWQTKDTPDQGMTLYTIRADGTLWWRPYHHESVPKEERPYPNEPDDSFLAYAGSIRRVEAEPQQLADFHGDIYFYNGSKNLGWWDYRARFTNGAAIIALNEYEPPNARLAEGATPTPNTKSPADEAR